MSLTNHEALEAIRVWVDDPAFSATALKQRLVGALEGNVLQNPEIAPEPDERGRLLVAFTIDPPPGYVGNKVRRMLPVHAAITRVLELSGAAIRLDRPRDSGRERFHLSMKLGPITTTLPRILFAAPEGGRMNERDGGDFRTIVPSNFVFSQSADRADVLAVVRERMGSEMESLLRDLFALADRLHGTELLFLPRRHNSECGNNAANKEPV
jgi:hypothetical protein